MIERLKRLFSRDNDILHIRHEQAAEKCRDDYNRKFGHVWGEATIAAFTRLER